MAFGSRPRRGPRSGGAGRKEKIRSASPEPDSSGRGATADDPRVLDNLAADAARAVVGNNGVTVRAIVVFVLRSLNFRAVD